MRPLSGIEPVPKSTYLNAHGKSRGPPRLNPKNLSPTSSGAIDTVRSLGGIPCELNFPVHLIRLPLKTDLKRIPCPFVQDGDLFNVFACGLDLRDRHAIGDIEPQSVGLAGHSLR